MNVRAAPCPKVVAFAAVVSAAAIACSQGPARKPEPLGVLPSAVTTAEPLWIPFSIAAGSSQPHDPRETKLEMLRQLTTDGHSRGAVWHPDGTSIYFTRATDANACGEVMHMDLVTGKTERVSPGPGWSTSPAPFGDRLVFLHGSGEAKPVCPSAPPQIAGHLGSYDAFVKSPQKPAVELLGGLAEIGAAADGSHLVFTSMRDGDPEVYVTDAAGGHIRRVTRQAGYDGGASLAPNGAKLAWHSERVSESERPDYDARLADGRVQPKRLEIVVATLSGEEPRVIAYGAMSVTPTFMPDSRRVLFSSTADDLGGGEDGVKNFEIYLVDPDGPVTIDGGPRVDRVTFADGYDGQARMSPDGEYVLFTSSRGATGSATNVFVARWLGD